jgi:hypothetical protein
MQLVHASRRCDGRTQLPDCWRTDVYTRVEKSTASCALSGFPASCRDPQASRRQIDVGNGRGARSRVPRPIVSRSSADRSCVVAKWLLHVAARWRPLGTTRSGTLVLPPFLHPR